MKIVPIFCSLLLLFFVRVNAQSLTKIEGYVFSTDGLPIENANVIIAGSAFGTATDERGFFELHNLFAGEYTIAVNHIGYEKSVLQVFVGKDIPARIIFHLKPFIGVVEEIVVSAKRDSIRNSIFKINLTAEQIKNSTARTLGELLLQIPGISIIDEGTGSGRKRITIRGSNPNQVLVLLDGVPLNDPLSGEADLNMIPLSMIEEVTIQKGGNAAQSGSGAMGGQVEIKTRQVMQNEIRLAVNAGSFNAWGIQSSLSGMTDHLSGLFSYDYQTEKGDYPYTYYLLDGSAVSERRLNAGMTARQYFLKAGYTAGLHNILLQANIYNSERGLPGTVFFWTPYASADVLRQLFAIHYLLNADKFNLAMQLSAYENNSEYENLWPPDPPLKYKRVPPYHTDYQLQSYQGELNTTWQWSLRNAATIRLDYRRDLFKDQDLLTQSSGPIQEADNLQTAIALENTWQFPAPDWMNRSSLKLALRYDRIRFQNQEFNRIDTYLSPKIGLYLGNESDWLWSLQVNYGRSFRSPTFADLYYQDFRVRGNAALLPEKSVDVDAGIRFALPWLGKPEIALSYFRQDIKNLIVWELGSFATWQPANLDAFIEGREFDLSWPLWPEHLTIQLNHIQLNARDRSDRYTTHDKYLTYRPEHTSRIGLDFHCGDFALTYQKRIISDRFVTAANTVSLPAYQVDDLTVRFSLISDPLAWQFRAALMNIFDTRYEIVRDAPLPGRHWRMGLDVAY